MKRRLLMCRLASVMLLFLHGAAEAVSGDELYAKPGQLVTASDGGVLNFYCMGSGSRTVVFDAGHGDWSPSWSVMQPAVAKWTRACSYDRGGVGFSGPAVMPRTAERLAEELHSALHKAGILGPYILVGHATGAYPARAFADQHLREVAGLVLIEGDARDVEASADLKELWHGINVRNLAELHMCRDAVSAGKSLPLATPPADHPAWTCLNYFFRGLPEAEFSAALNARLLEIVSTNISIYDALISEVEARPVDDEYLRTHRISLGSRPLRLITADHHISDSPGTTPERHREHERFNEQRKLFQRRLLDLSSNAKQVFTQTGPYVQLDAPNIVLEAIREVYDQSK